MIGRAIALVGSGLFIILGGVTLGVAAFTKTISPPAMWLVLAAATCIAGVALMIYGERPFFVPHAPPPPGATTAGGPIDDAPVASTRRPRLWAYILGWALVALNLPMAAIVATGHGDALGIFNVAMGLVVAAVFLAIGRHGRRQ